MVLQDADTSSMLQLEDYSILPSTFLPPIRKICDLSSRNLVKLVTILADIYTPDVFGTKSEAVHSPRSNFSGNRQLMPHSERLEKGNEGNQSSEYEGLYTNPSHPSSLSIPVPDSTQLATLRADEFERAYAIKWLTGLIARSDEWIESQDNIDDSSNTQDERITRERIIEKACALLAVCSGSLAQGAITRTFRFLPKFPSNIPFESHTSSQSDNGNHLRDRLLTIVDLNSPNTIQTMHNVREIQVQLKDDAVPAQDQDAVGLQTWGCAPILAELISEDIGRFGLDLRETAAKNRGQSSMDIKNEKADNEESRRNEGIEREAAIRGEMKDGCGEIKEVSDELPIGDGESLGMTDGKPRLRILELGAGTGLLSIFLWRLLESQSDFLVTSNAWKRAPDHSSNQEDEEDPRDITDINYEIVVTDYHPSVLENMTYNIQLNTSPSSPPVHSESRNPSTPPGIRLRNECLDWTRPPILEEEDKYDLVFGADIVYEKGHAALIRGVVERALRKPKGGDGITDPGGVFWLMYPLRHTHTAESESIEREFGVASRSMAGNRTSNEGYQEEKQKTLSLGVIEEQSLTRKKGMGRGDDEVEYRVLKIGWMYK